MSDYALPRGTLTGAPVDWTWQFCPQCAHTYRIWVLGLPRQARPDWCCPACRWHGGPDAPTVAVALGSDTPVGADDPAPAGALVTA